MLVVESTRGNRLHRPLKETIDEWVFVIEDTMRRRHGNIIIPAFALGRAQELLYLLVDLCPHSRLPRLQVFVDSPMAAKATEITWKHSDFLDQETRKLLSLRNEHPEWPDLRFTQSVEESIGLNDMKSGALIITASGMCEAGRIKHHLRRNVGRAACAILIIGFQAVGTLGRRPCTHLWQADRCPRRHPHRCRPLDARRSGGVARLAEGLRRGAGRTFVVHGESATACRFADQAADELGWSIEALGRGTPVDL